MIRLSGLCDKNTITEISPSAYVYGFNTDARDADERVVFWNDMKDDSENVEWLHEKVTWPHICAVERSIQKSEDQDLLKEAALSHSEIPRNHADID